MLIHAHVYVHVHAHVLDVMGEGMSDMDTSVGEIIHHGFLVTVYRQATHT